jgi:hypothetical protein
MPHTQSGRDHRPDFAQIYGIRRCRCRFVVSSVGSAVRGSSNRRLLLVPLARVVCGCAVTASTEMSKTAPQQADDPAFACL